MEEITRYIFSDTAVLLYELTGIAVTLGITFRLSRNKRDIIRGKTEELAARKEEELLSSLRNDRRN